MLQEILNLVVYLLVEILNYVLCYHLLLGARIGKVKKILLGVILIFVFHFIVYFTMNSQASSALSIFSMIVIPLTAFDKAKKGYFLSYPFINLSLGTIGISASYFLSLLTKIPLNFIISGSWYTILCQSAPMLMLVIYYVAVGKGGNEKRNIDLGWKQYVMFILVSISMFLMMAPIQNLSINGFRKEDVSIIGAATTLGCILLVFIVIWQIISLEREYKAKERSEILENSMEMQKKYYESLLLQEEKMRRFRHDANSHVIALRGAAQKGNLDEIKRYLDDLASQTELDRVSKFTGNSIADALIINMKEEAEGKGIEVRVQAGLLVRDKIDGYDLCIILSNLFRNAIEACEKLEEEKRYIGVAIAMYENQLFIGVKNPVGSPVMRKGNRLITSKKKSLYHGLGYGNLEYAVNKYEGSIECIIKEDEFEVEIMI